MRKLTLLVMLLSFFRGYTQVKTNAAPFATAKYAGVYGYGKDVQQGRVGFITLFSESDSTLLFYIELNRGAPSYNMGGLYGRLKLENNIGNFSKKKN